MQTRRSEGTRKGTCSVREPLTVGEVKNSKKQRLARSWAEKAEGG